MWSVFASQTIYLDSNIFIHALEGGPRWAQVTAQMLDEVDRLIIASVTSELTIAEVMTKPLATGNSELIAKYERIFQPNSALGMVPINREIPLPAAQVQARAGTKLADAIHVATAYHTGCRYFLTQDDRLGRAFDRGLTRLSLADVEKS
jgi:predicted nucleic acid-binding protein